MVIGAWPAAFLGAVRRTREARRRAAPLTFGAVSLSVLAIIRSVTRTKTWRSQLPEEQRHEFTRGLFGWITHTELSSSDPPATRDWCGEVLGWSFQPAFPTPAGDYHLFAYSETGGGGIRETAPNEAPGSTPTVHVESTQQTYERALAAGAESIDPPTKVMEGVCTALVRAPGGVLIGFSGPTD